MPRVPAARIADTACTGPSCESDDCKEIGTSVGMMNAHLCCSGYEEGGVCSRYRQKTECTGPACDQSCQDYTTKEQCIGSSNQECYWFKDWDDNFSLGVDDAPETAQTGKCATKTGLEKDNQFGKVTRNKQDFLTNDFTCSADRVCSQRLWRKDMAVTFEETGLKYTAKECEIIVASINTMIRAQGNTNNGTFQWRGTTSDSKVPHGCLYDPGNRPNDGTLFFNFHTNDIPCQEENGAAGPLCVNRKPFDP